MNFTLEKVIYSKEEIKMTVMKRVLMVDGKPFYPLGSEWLNMSG